MLVNKHIAASGKYVTNIFTEANEKFSFTNNLDGSGVLIYLDEEEQIHITYLINQSDFIETIQSFMDYSMITSEERIEIIDVINNILKGGC